MAPHTAPISSISSHSHPSMSQRNTNARKSTSTHRRLNSENNTRECCPSNRNGRGPHSPVNMPVSPSYEDEPSSEPEGEINNSSKPRGHNQIQSLSCTQLRNQTHERNHSNTGHPLATDLVTQQRRLCKEISLTIKGNSKKRKLGQVSFLIFDDF